jgi:hypothetical protein
VQKDLCELFFHKICFNFINYCSLSCGEVLLLKASLLIQAGMLPELNFSGHLKKIHLSIHKLKKGSMTVTIYITSKRLK